MSDRSTPEHKHCISHEFIDITAVFFNDRMHPREKPVYRCGNFLWVKVFRYSGKTADIHKKNRGPSSFPLYMRTIGVHFDLFNDPEREISR